ncbi:hydratase [Fusibacter paucivorans]|uniref:Hydratase n=1 Tax=Fusibacter paucivorans TaxID=76009 RepID=A0ABS5PMF5_9FIRM|nr:hydratase [Fusibacter paucivorans]MBS7526042.1 hydratase [Fusibacter paucivorans]
MIKLDSNGTFVFKGQTILDAPQVSSPDALNLFLTNQGLEPMALESEADLKQLKKNTIAYGILQAHNTSDNTQQLQIKFDSMASHDITYVGIVQTAKASGLTSFPMPYVLTNCHNSLCAVGGTINEDDHVFGLSAAKKYGGIYVPAHQAVIHQYMREMMAGCGKMILGSDSHTRYGALGTMAIGEGGPELVKQLLSKTYDISMPEIIAVYLEGEVSPGVGPQDVALALIGKVFTSGFVKNKVLEFIGPGIEKLTIDFRNGIDVMTTETTCLSSIWMTDDKVKDYYAAHHRTESYAALTPGDIAYYDGLVHIDLNKIVPMIALPFHPSNVYTLDELIANPYDILGKVEKESKAQLENPNVHFKLTDKIIDGKIMVNQGVIAGCAGGTFENVYLASEILKQKSIGNDYFKLSVYPSSQPVFMDLIHHGAITNLMAAGAEVKTAFCGPCFGAGDVPANNGLSIRHTTRNFPSREGSKPGSGQIASVALMDARSIAATSANGGILTSATAMRFANEAPKYTFNEEVYNHRVYFGFGKANPDETLKYGPNIADWPEMPSLKPHLLLKMASVINDPVTTTDELIPSGETSSYRSNPLKLAEFTLSRKDPGYVNRAKAAHELAKLVISANTLDELDPENELYTIFKSLCPDKASCDNLLQNTLFGSTIFAVKPGDGSAREQAASCQKVLGGLANIVNDYATKRYRSNLINWGMLPFTFPEGESYAFKRDDYVFIKDVKKGILNANEQFDAVVLSKSNSGHFEQHAITLEIKGLTDDERAILLAGCLINYNAPAQTTIGSLS